MVFFKDPYTPQRLRAMGLNERQMQIIATLQHVESASVGDLRHQFPNLSTKTIQRDIQELVQIGLLSASGEKKGRRYGLAR